MIPLLIACSEPPEPEACVRARTPAPGPLAAEAAAAPDLLELARVRLREARLTADDGFYTLADAAVACARHRFPGDVDAARLDASLKVQFHRFSEAEAGARALLVADPDDAVAGLVLVDALAEQGRVQEAGEALRALASRPDAAVLDRASWLAWLQGDADGARAAARSAAALANDPEGRAWALAWWGWLDVLGGGPGQGLVSAIEIAPDAATPRFYRGRQRLHDGDRTGALDDLRRAGRTVEAWRARAEAGDDVALAAVAGQDPRAWAILRVEDAPAESVAALRRESESRRDPLTRAALLWARHRNGEEVRTEFRALADGGLVEPRALLWAGLALDDDDLLSRALATGPGLLPSEVEAARGALAHGQPENQTRSAVQ